METEDKRETLGLVERKGRRVSQGTHLSVRKEIREIWEVQDHKD